MGYRRGVSLLEYHSFELLIYFVWEEIKCSCGSLRAEVAWFAGNLHFPGVLHLT